MCFEGFGVDVGVFHIEMSVLCFSWLAFDTCPFFARPACILDLSASG